jgi:SnoaL-like domain
MNTARKLVYVVVFVLAASLAGLLWSMDTRSHGSSPSGLTTAQFRERMEQLADAWNRGNARAAADLFAENALYSSPPNSRIHQGREELFEWFGGVHGRPKPMRMVWHHVVFDEAQQIGAGEYTFTYMMRTHGMALIRLQNGKIANWREYEIESAQDWEVMVGKNQF